MCGRPYICPTIVRLGNRSLTDAALTWSIGLLAGFLAAFHNRYACDGATRHGYAQHDVGSFMTSSGSRLYERVHWGIRADVGRGRHTATVVDVGQDSDPDHLSGRG